MVVDTAKIILASFPISCRLVVAGIGPEHQSSMKEMLNAIETNDSCMVLFPSEDAKTFSEMMNPESFEGKRKSIDLIVIDGTWEQARRLFKRYLADGLRQPQCICLSEEALTTLSRNEMDDGRQLRRHPIKWREVSTLTATRLLLHDMNPLGPWDTLGEYQSLADGAARRQLGTIRERKGGQ